MLNYIVCALCGKRQALTEEAGSAKFYGKGHNNRRYCRHCLETMEGQASVVEFSTPSEFLAYYLQKPKKTEGTIKRKKREGKKAGLGFAEKYAFLTSNPVEEKDIAVLNEEYQLFQESANILEGILQDNASGIAVESKSLDSIVNIIMVVLEVRHRDITPEIWGPLEVVKNATTFNMEYYIENGRVVVAFRASAYTAKNFAKLIKSALSRVHWWERGNPTSGERAMMKTVVEWSKDPQGFATKNPNTPKKSKKEDGEK